MAQARPRPGRSLFPVRDMNTYAWIPAAAPDGDAKSTRESCVGSKDFFRTTKFPCLSSSSTRFALHLCEVPTKVFSSKVEGVERNKVRP